MVIAQTMLRVLVVDDHPVVREGLRAVLTSDSHIEIAEEASSGEEALEKVRLLEPDVVLVDIRMPGMSGIEFTRQVKAERPEIAVVLVTMYDSEIYLAEALRAGAAGYIVKDSSREFLLRAVDAAVSGATIVTSSLLRDTIRGLTRGSQRFEDGRADAAVNDRFTPREFEVLRLVAQGYPNKKIASELNLAEVTVKKYVQGVIAKLGVSDRTQAAIAGVHMGIVQ